MRKPKIYLETTMFNYYLDSERGLLHEDTVKLFKEIKNGKFEAFTSTHVIEELERAPELKRQRMLQLVVKYNLTVLESSIEIESLAKCYVDEGIIPEGSRFDSLHIATATWHGIDYIFSLNFKHINRLKTKRATAYINEREGYRPVTILSPMEEVEDEEKT